MAKAIMEGGLYADHRALFRHEKGHPATAATWSDLEDIMLREKSQRETVYFL